MKLCRMILCKRGCRAWMRGSYTLEAAFVVPIILGIIFSLMYVLFYEHDRLVACGNVREGILHCAVNGEKFPEQYQWQKQIQSDLWIGKVTDGDIHNSTFEIKGDAKITLGLAIPVIHMFLGEKQEIYCEEAWSIWQPAEAVRWKGKDKDRE